MQDSLDQGRGVGGVLSEVVVYLGRQPKGMRPAPPASMGGGPKTFHQSQS